MEPMHYVAATTVRSQMSNTLAFSARPDAPVLPERRQRLARLRLTLQRRAIRRPHGRHAPVRPAGVC